MAVLQMQRISIYALRKDRKPILEWIQRRGAVEINDALEEDNVFQRMDVSTQKAQIEKNIAASKQALEILNRYAPEKKSLFAVLEGRTEIPVEQANAFGGKSDDVLRVAHRLNERSKDIADCRGLIQKLQTQMEALKPWMNLDISMRTKGKKSTTAFVGSFPAGYTAGDLEEQIALLAPKGPVYARGHQHFPGTNLHISIVHRADAQVLEEALRTLGFARPSSPTKTPPAERMRVLQERMEEQEQIIQEAEQEITGYASQRDDLKFLVDYLTMRSEKYDVIGRLMQSRRTFVLTGYIPQQDAGKLTQELEGRFGAVVELEAPAQEDDVPVLLKNNKFSEPVEGVLESFSLPGKTEVDPTSIMAIFYYILFGMMLSDAAYGLIMVIGCGLALLKFKNMEPSMNKSLRMFFFCGISTTFWGFLFGSFFGDAVRWFPAPFSSTRSCLGRSGLSRSKNPCGC
ncbi:MAG: V-type ATP synthase subunit I [Anaeromassilibacillus sp.]